MKTRNSTKSKLLSSVIALVLCVSMLIGATFAWFTDTASTAVNKIQAGNLDVQLLGADGNSLEGQTLSWQKAAGHENESLLWEPGCTYNLTPFKIKNNGNLALKYQISITGIVGNAELLNAIDFTVTGVTGATTAAALNGFEGRLAPNSETALITITGKMKTTAGNEYQGKSIDGIGITVRATQLGGTHSDVSGENDSFNNEYDKEATYPPLASYINNTTEKGVTLDGDGKTSTSVAIVIEDANAKSTIPAGTEVYSDDSNTLVATNDSGSLNRDIKTTEATADSVTYDISYKYVDSNGTSTPVVKFGNVVENVIDVSTGLRDVKVTHTHGTTTTAMTPANNPATRADGTYYYDSANGKIYIWSSEYSSFKIEYQSDFEAAVNGQGYATLKEAITVAHAASENVTVTLLKDVTLAADLQLGTGQRGVNLNLNGKTIDGGTHQVYTAGDGTINIYGGGTIKNNNTTANNSNVAALYIPTGSSVVLDGVTLEGYYGVYANGTLEIKNAVIIAVDCGIAANGNAQVTIGAEGTDSNVTVTASAGNCISTQAAAGATGMNVTVYNGSFTSSGTPWTMCPIYWASHGTLNVYGGTFKNTTSGTGAAALLQKNGTVKVFGGTFEAKDGIKLVAQSDSTEIVTAIQGGAFTGTRSGIYIDASSSAYMGQLSQYSVSIANNGDTVPQFVGGTEGAIYAKTGGLGGKTLMTLTGGSFNEDPSSYLADDKMAVQDEDGMFNVITDTRVKTEEQLKTAVEAGGEVTLGADITLTSTLYIAKDVTLNLGAYTISGKEKSAAVALKNDSGTIKVVVNATTGGIRASGSNGDCFEMHSNNKGTVELTINGGNYSSTSAYLVDISAGSTTPEGRRDKLFINGGTYSGNRIINANPANTEVVMTAGSLTGTNGGIKFGRNSTNAKFTMSGGSVTYQAGSVITAQAQGNTIDIRDNAVVTGKLFLKNCTMNITGGTVNITGGNTDNRAIMVSGGTTLNISGNAKVSGDPLFNMNEGAVNITGGMFKGKIVNGLNFGNDYLQSVKDLLTDVFSLSNLNGDGWYQVVPNE